MNAGDFTLLMFGIKLPLDKRTTFFTGGCRFQPETFAGTGLALPDRLQHFGAAGKNIGYRFANQVLGATTKMSEKRFVAKKQSAIGINKRAERVLRKTHR